MSDSLHSRHAQVLKILESRTFRDTEVLKRLLDYLAQQAMKKNGSDLKEYTVGIEAFGKTPDYNPQVDSSVRVQAGKLRQRLETYYRTEGAEDAVIVELPKGHFNLEFSQRQPAANSVSKHKGRNWFWVGGGLMLLLASVFLVIYVTRLHGRVSESGWSPEMEEFWGPFLSPSRPVMVVMGTPLFVKIGDSFFRDPSINDWDTASKSDRVAGVEHAAGASFSSAAFNYTGVGEAESAFELQRLLLAQGNNPIVQASNNLNWEDIVRYNMIFLGPPKYIPQLLELPVPQDFEILHSRVQNLHPAPGEPQFFEEKWSPNRDNLEEGHALISRLPGLHGTGEILVLAGSSTESTRAAAEFVTHPEYVASLVHQMHEQGGVPKWFQLVVRVQFKSKTPISIRLVAFHSLK